MEDLLSVVDVGALNDVLNESYRWIHLVVSDGPGFVHSGADRKKETSGQRAPMEEIQEREEPVLPKDSTPPPSSPQTPQTPDPPQRASQSADGSRGHAPPKRFL